MDDREVFWGDFHKHLQDIDNAGSIVESARENLDFYPLLCYPFVWFLQEESGDKEYLGQPSDLSDAFPEAEESSDLLVESTGHRKEYDQWWEVIKETAAEYHDPGNFATLIGYEWHGDRKRYGDNNVIYFGGEGELDPARELPDLYDRMRGEKALVIPHHIGYKNGRRGKDWDFFDEDLSPVAEIFSYHGSSEGEPSRLELNNNPSMGPGQTRSFWQEGLDRGYRVGAIASNDGPGLPGGYGNGLAAVRAESLTRNSLYQALQERRTYAVTGDRIELEYYVDGTPMGGVIEGTNAAEVDYSVSCPDVLKGVELIVNGKRERVYNHLPERNPKGAKRFNLKVDFGWGPAEHYGLQADDLEWIGGLEVEEGELIDVDGCFTLLDQELSWKDKSANWKLKTRRSNNELNAELRQSLILKLRGSTETKLRFHGKGYDFTRTLGELSSRSEVIALEDFAREKVKENTGISEEDVLNDEVFYFNAPKIKLHRANTEPEREVRGSFHVEDLKEGRNYLYLRVLEANGQMAWSSPVWIDR